MSRRRILRRQPGEARADALPASLHPVLRRVYGLRGVATEGDLDLRLERLAPVSSLGGVDAAVDLLLSVHRRDGRIVVVGDFDADGATSTALVIRQLRRLGFRDPEFIVPDRFRFGYGLTPEIVEVAAVREPTLLVTVDNGVSSIDGVAAARRSGIDVLVTDHHLPGSALPDATAIVNPNLRGGSFPSRALAGVGVAFYVMAALTRRMRDEGLLDVTANVNPADLLDLVALGTVADLVPLDTNNRILVAQGLRRIRAGRVVPGIRALLEVAGRGIDSTIAQDLGFQAAPRLNAAGRLEDMGLGIECLLTADPVQAQALAERLSRLNVERRGLEARMQQEALEQVDGLVDSLEGRLPAGVCLFDSRWHQGIIGLVASRVKDRVHRPVIAFAPAESGWLKGSARSIAGVHVRDVLEAIATRHPGLLERFGGHAMAAGMTLHESSFDEFSVAFADEVARWVDVEELRGDLHTDGPLAAGEFRPETAFAIREGGPWGSGFPEPVFDGEFAIVGSRVVGDRHLKLRLRADSGETVDAIAFRYLDEAGSAPLRPGQRLEGVYRTSIDDYSGLARLQLVVEYLHELA